MMVVEALVRGAEENHTTQQYSFVRTQHQRHIFLQNDRALRAVSKHAL